MIIGLQEVAKILESLKPFFQFPIGTFCITVVYEQEIDIGILLLTNLQALFSFHQILHARVCV